MFFSLKLFSQLSQNDCQISFEQFEQMWHIPKYIWFVSRLFPQVLRYMDQTERPSENRVEKASRFLKGKQLSQTEYIYSFNGGVFL